MSVHPESLPPPPARSNPNLEDALYPPNPFDEPDPEPADNKNPFDEPEAESALPKSCVRRAPRPVDMSKYLYADGSKTETDAADVLDQ